MEFSVIEEKASTGTVEMNYGESSLSKSPLKHQKENNSDYLLALRFHGHQEEIYPILSSKLKEAGTFVIASCFPISVMEK